MSERRTEPRSYLRVVELEEGLEVTDEVWVDTLQRFEQRHSGQFAVGLLVAVLLIEMQAATEGKITMVSEITFAVATRHGKDVRRSRLNQSRGVILPIYHHC